MYVEYHGRQTKDYLFHFFFFFKEKNKILEHYICDNMMLEKYINLN